MGCAFTALHQNLNHLLDAKASIFPSQHEFLNRGHDRLFAGSRLRAGVRDERVRPVVELIGVADLLHLGGQLRRPAERWNSLARGKNTENFELFWASKAPHDRRICWRHLSPPRTSEQSQCNKNRELRSRIREYWSAERRAPKR
jgi:hypothetical protein